MPLAWCSQALLFTSCCGRTLRRWDGFRLASQKGFPGVGPKISDLPSLFICSPRSGPGNESCAETERASAARGRRDGVSIRHVERQRQSRCRQGIRHRQLVAPTVAPACSPSAFSAASASADQCMASACVVAAPASVASACADRMRNAARSLAAKINSCTESVPEERERMAMSPRKTARYCHTSRETRRFPRTARGIRL